MEGRDHKSLYFKPALATRLFPSLTVVLGQVTNVTVKIKNGRRCILCKMKARKVVKSKLQSETKFVVKSEPESQINEVIVDNHIVRNDTNLIVKNTNSAGQTKLVCGLFVF